MRTISRPGPPAVGALAVAVCLTSAAFAGAQPSPREYLGYPVGTDRRLADWTEITGYLSELAASSDRIRLDTLGATTLGRPFVLVTISDPSNLAALEHLREVQGELADPRRIRDSAHREALIRAGRTIVLITCSIHSTEVGSSQLPLRMAYRLASSDDPETREILENTVVLLVPSLNPDGVDLVVDWYRRSVGTPWEGASPPFLYHHYVGHDNNRDWYAFTQVETRLAVDRLHNVWHPQIVHDVHQQGSYGSRFFVPPWLDPIEPNVDPLLISAANALGTEIAWSLVREGKKGVVVHAIYDAWTPARAYPHYHAGVRLLSETASATLATPLEVSPEELEGRRGFDPLIRSWNFPEPWEGGIWRLADIIDYMEAGAFSLLRHAARNRETWLRNFLAVGERAVAGWSSWPTAWVIPADGGQTAGGGPEAAGDHRVWPQIGVVELVTVLRRAGVEVERARRPFLAAARRFPAGTYIVKMRQPYAAFAQAVLEAGRYPDLREYKEGPLLEPYDVTAHALPLLFGVEAVAVEAPIDVETEAVEAAPHLPVSLTSAAGLAGSATRVALYQPWDPSIDEGWTRWIFDRFGVSYATVHNQEINSGRLDGFTSLLLPSIAADVLREGRGADSVPPGMGGGLSAAGVAALREFLVGGGTLVALNRSADWVIEELELPVRNVVAGLEGVEYSAPGSLVRIEIDRRSGMGDGLPKEMAAWLEGGAAFEAVGSAGVRTVARYAAEPLLLSGWLQGSEYLSGRAAVVEVAVGKGRVILFGVRPQYRGQSLATLPLLFAALRPAGPE